jgi:hypothetical protein
MWTPNCPIVENGVFARTRSPWASSFSGAGSNLTRVEAFASVGWAACEVPAAKLHKLRNEARSNLLANPTTFG